MIYRIINVEITRTETFDILQTTKSQSNKCMFYYTFQAEKIYNDRIDLFGIIYMVGLIGRYN